MHCLKRLPRSRSRSPAAESLVSMSSMVSSVAEMSFGHSDRLTASTGKCLFGCTATHSGSLLQSFMHMDGRRRQDGRSRA